MNYPEGLEPYIARQSLLRHTFSPVVSLQVTYNAELLLRKGIGNNDISLLQILRPYGNNALYPTNDQVFKVTNNQLITRTYASFPVRFEPPLPELVSLMNGSSASGRTGNAAGEGKLQQLFSVSSLEVLLKHLSAVVRDKTLYQLYFEKVITSKCVVPFDTFNHPVSQIFVIDYHNDTLADLRENIVKFRNFNFPKYFQLDDLLVFVFILYDPSQINDTSKVQLFQTDIKNKLDVNSIIVPIPEYGKSEDESFKLSQTENSTIEEDIQRIFLQLNAKSSSVGMDFIDIPSGLDQSLRKKIYDFISKYLIPHMEKKVRIWDDQILSPKRSITGRFFSVSKRLFNNNENMMSPDSGHSSYNSNENYYHKSAPEQTLRKLADWAIILKDFKYAYSTYDVIKKDYINDKAWAYVASTQEMCIISLILAQTQKSNLLASKPDKNTLRKIRHDIIEPYLDNLSYTFNSRLNLRTYHIRTLVTVIELLLCMCETYNIPSWLDLIEKNLCKCISEFDAHLAPSSQKLQVVRSLLYERIGYTLGRCIFLHDEDRRLLSIYQKPVPKVGTPTKEEEDVEPNPYKLEKRADIGIMGLTRFRQSSIWYILSIKEWMLLENYAQVNYLLQNIKATFNIDDITEEWYDRDDLVLYFIKDKILQNKDVSNADT